jgi:glycosyltransferase involved in cell wall biosynthesis
MNIAIFSPNKNPYSETFIQAHKNLLEGEIYYYYGNTWTGITLEKGNEKFNKLSFTQKIKLKLSGGSVTQSQQQNLIDSIKNNKIEVALVEYGHHAHWLLPVLKAANIPFVVHFHGHDASETTILKNVNNYSSVFHQASAVIAVSKIMSKDLIAMGCSKDKIHYTPCGPNEGFATIQPDFKSEQFAFVGRFTNKKAPYYCLFALKKVLSEFPNAKLVMAGDGVLQESCINISKSLKLEKSVTFKGVVTPKEVRTLYKNSIGFVLPSVKAENGDSEGTPVAVMEASLAGLPVISTYHAGIPDVIVDQETGLLCDEHDVEAMALNMQKILSDLEFAKTMGAAGRRRINEHYTLKRHIDTVNSILRDAVNA